MRMPLVVALAASVLSVALPAQAAKRQHPASRRPSAVYEATPAAPAPPPPEQAPPPEKAESAQPTKSPPRPPEPPAAQTEPSAITAAPEPPEPAAQPWLVGVKGGVALPTSALKTTWLTGADVTYRLPWQHGTLTVGLDGAYSQPGLSATVTDAAVGTYTYALRQRLVSAALELGARTPVAMQSEAYINLGYALFLLQAQSTAFGNEQIATQWASGLQARVGAGWLAGPGEVFAELRYHFVRLNFRTTGATTSGAALGAAAGYRFVL